MHCTAAKCACTAFHEPMMFGTACQICGHGRALHITCDPATCARCPATVPARPLSQTMPVLASPADTPLRSALARTSLSSYPGTPRPRAATMQAKAPSLAPEAGTRCMREGCARFVPLDRRGQPVPYCSRECAHPHLRAGGAAPSPADKRQPAPTVEIASQQFTVRITPAAAPPGPAAKPPRLAARTRAERPQAASLQRTARLPSDAHAWAQDGAAGWSSLAYPPSQPDTARSAATTDFGDSSDDESIASQPAVSSTLVRPTLKLSAEEQQLVAAAGWTDAQLASVHELFRQYAQRPELTKEALVAFLRDAGLRGDFERFFAAFDRSDHATWITDRDFVCALAALDPRTPHCGHARAMRARFIFRFYSAGRKLMPWASFVQLVGDALRTSRTPHLSAQLLAERLVPAMPASLDEHIVTTLIESDRIPGAANLFRGYSNYSRSSRQLAARVTFR